MTIVVSCKYCSDDRIALRLAIHAAERRRWRDGTVDTSEINRLRQRISECQACSGTGDAEGRPLPLPRPPKTVAPKEPKTKPPLTVPVEVMQEAWASAAHIGVSARKAWTAICGTCGRSTPLKNDGTLKRHRPDPDTFAGPYCAGSGRVAA